MFKQITRLGVILLIVCGAYSTTYAQVTVTGQSHNLNYQGLTVPVPENCENECTALVSINDAFVMVHLKKINEVLTRRERYALDDHQSEDGNATHYEIHSITVPNGSLVESFEIHAAKQPDSIVASLQLECVQCATMVDIRLENKPLRTAKSLLLGLDDFGTIQILDLEQYSVRKKSDHTASSFDPGYEVGPVIPCDNPRTEVDIKFCYVDSDNNYHWGGTKCTYCGATAVDCSVFEHRAPVDETRNSPC